MKKIITSFLCIIFAIFGFAFKVVHNPKYIASALSISYSKIAEAQFNNSYNSTTSVVALSGQWSGNSLQDTRDSLDGAHFSFTRFNEYNVGARCLSNTFSTTTQTRIVGIDANGYMYPMNAPITPTITQGNGILVTGSWPTLTIFAISTSITAGNTNITVSGSDPNFTITPYVPTTYTVVRSINSSTFQPSSIRYSSVIYNALGTTTTTIGGASDGIFQLQFSTNGGTTWQNGTSMENGSTASLAAVLNLVNKQSGIVVLLNMPPSTIYRLVPTTTSATISYVVGFETY